MIAKVNLIGQSLCRLRHQLFFPAFELLDDCLPIYQCCLASTLIVDVLQTRTAPELAGPPEPLHMLGLIALGCLTALDGAPRSGIQVIDLVRVPANGGENSLRPRINATYH